MSFTQGGLGLLRAKSLLGFSLIILLLAAAACGSGSDREQKKKNNKPNKKTENKATATEDKPDEPQKLTKENAVDFLKKYGKKTDADKVKISTKYGDIKIKLFRNTPVHRANFLYLTDFGYFDMTEFYRVSPGFVCQAGNSDDYETQQRRADIGKYVLPAEFRDNRINKYGAVAMARQYKDNPDKHSSCYEFFINVGRPHKKKEIEEYEKKYGFNYTDDQVETYLTIGGNPHLDTDHTVFGEVIEGMDAVEEINEVKVDRREWPLESIPIEVEIIE